LVICRVGDRLDTPWLCAGGGGGGSKIHLVQMQGGEQALKPFVKCTVRGTVG
jgi:hypothetical protein